MVSQSVSLGVEPHMGLMTWYLLLFDSYGHVSVSLTRGRVCHLYMLLTLASAVFLGSESLGTRGHILLSQVWDFIFRRLLRLAGSRWRYSTPPPHGLLQTHFLSLSLSHVMTDGHSASLSWYKAPICGLRPDSFFAVGQLRVCWYGVLSLTRGLVCGLQLLLALASAVILGSESSWGSRSYLTVSDLRLLLSVIVGSIVPWL
jgi:hypothetical protein